MGFLGCSCWWISSLLLCSRLLLTSASSGNRTFHTGSPSNSGSAAAVLSAAIRQFILFEWPARSERRTMDFPRTLSSSLCRSLVPERAGPGAADVAASFSKSRFGSLGPGLGTEPPAASAPASAAFLHLSSSWPLLFLWDFFKRRVQNCSHSEYLHFRRARLMSTRVSEACHRSRASSSVRVCWIAN